MLGLPCRCLIGRVRRTKLFVSFAVLAVAFLVLLEGPFLVDRTNSRHGADRTYTSSKKSLGGVSYRGHYISGKDLLKTNSVEGVEKVEIRVGPHFANSPRRWSRTTHSPHGHSAPFQQTQNSRIIMRKQKPKYQWNKLAYITKPPSVLIKPRLHHMANRVHKGQQAIRAQLPLGLLGGVANAGAADIASRNSAHRFSFHRFREVNNRNLDFQELPVSRAAAPTSGHPWPYPQFYHYNATIVHILDIDKTEFSVTGVTCDVLEKGLDRQKKYFRWLVQGRSVARKKSLLTGWMILKKVKVTVLYKCDAYPRLDSDESYDLYTQDNKLFLRASEVWGVLLGLQTLSQLVVSSRGYLILKDIRISDFPRFKHRGIMLDTARHYLSKRILFRNLDAMAANKLNVFHWHIVDDQSFPYKSIAFPQMSIKGAYSATSVYTQKDIKEVVEYARLRGIRVIPELDTPGHVQSWVGLPEVLTPCSGGITSYGPVDPTRSATYEKLPELFEEILSLFPAATLHMGGDECSYYCWARNNNITNFMKSHHMAGDFKALFSYYFTRLQKALTDKLRDKLHTLVYWQEVFDENVKLNNNSIVHVWKDDYSDKLSEVTRAGHRVLLSSCWYLNYISYGSDWHKYYICDPQQFAGTAHQKALVVGGEACMWGEFVDDSNLLAELWPRASAVAERLWSPQVVSNPFMAEARFEENRCRLIRNGIPAKAIGGPGPPCTDFWDT